MTRGLLPRFRQLDEARAVTNVEDLADVQQANYDAYSAMLGSFLDVRIAYLRVCVDMQENPKSITLSMGHLKAKIDDGVIFWQHLLKRSRSLKSEIGDLEAKLQDMKWAKRHPPASLVERVRRRKGNFPSSRPPTHPLWRVSGRSWKASAH